MDDKVRIALRDLVDTHGESLLSSRDRLRGMLSDECPENVKEIHVLTIAAQAHVAAELRDARDVRMVLLASIRRLEKTYSLDRAAAVWAVLTTSYALGRVSMEQFQNLLRELSADAPRAPQPQEPVTLTERKRESPQEAAQAAAQPREGTPIPRQVPQEAGPAQKTEPAVQVPLPPQPDPPAQKPQSGRSRRTTTLFVAVGFAAAVALYIFFWRPAQTSEIVSGFTRSSNTLQGDAFRYCPNGECFWLSQRKQIQMWDARTLKPTGKKIDTSTIGAYRAEVSADGELIAYMEPDNAHILVRKISDWTILTTLPPSTQLSFDSTSRRLALAGYARDNVTVWDAQSGDSLMKFDKLGHIDDASPLARFSPDGRFLAYTSHDTASRCNISIVSAGTWNLQQTFAIHGECSDLVFSPDGQYLAVTTLDGVRMFNTNDWSLFATLKRSVLRMRSIEAGSLAFSNDSRLLADITSNRGGFLGSGEILGLGLEWRDDTINVWSVRDKRLIESIHDNERGDEIPWYSSEFGIWHERVLFAPKGYSFAVSSSNYRRVWFYEAKN